MIRFTYRDLLELVEGDEELIVRLVEEELVVRREDIVTIDVDRVLLARTLWRDLDIDWDAVEIILKLATELDSARQRIAELEAALTTKR
jgi:hypothetical protein